MAKFNQGVHGNLSGRIGTVVASSWRGINVFKIRPKKSTKPKTLAQLDQQSKFALIMHFLGRIDSVIKVGYQVNTGTTTAINAAFKYHEENAISGAYPNYTLDYSKVLLSEKKNSFDIQRMLNETMDALTLNSVVLTWETFPNWGAATQASDKLTLLFYNPVKDVYQQMEGLIIRSAETVTINFPRLFTGDSIHGWAFFVSDDGKLVSETTYLGQVIIKE